MINEIATEEQIRRTDELPVSCTVNSWKRNGYEEDEEVDHVARIFEFFSRDSVIRTVLLLQTMIAILSYWILNTVFEGISRSFSEADVPIPLATKLLFFIRLTILTPENFFETVLLHSDSSGIQYIILHTAVFFIISIPFAVIYFLFRKRQKLFFYYFLATFPQQMLLLIGTVIIFSMLHLPFYYWFFK